MMTRKKSSVCGMIVRLPMAVGFKPSWIPIGTSLKALSISGVRPVANLDAARSGPAYQIGSLLVSGFKPMLVSPISPYLARTGSISPDGLAKAKNASLGHFDGLRTVSTLTRLNELRASEVQFATF